jgi:hypothetical protein
MRYRVIIVEGTRAMTIVLPLEPQKEAQLILAEASPATRQDPTRSLRGLLAKYGPAPSAEEIDQNRAEMLANFPRNDF